ncbi:hypothetical protein D3C86_1494740 [compost metagenome]
MPAHLVPGYPHLGLHQTAGQIVDQPKDRQRRGLDGLAQALIAHRAEQDGVAPFLHAALQLLALLGEGAIAPRFVDLQFDPQPFRLVHHALIDRKPVGVAQMGVEGTEGQRFGCGGGFRPLLTLRLAAEFAALPEIDRKGEGGARKREQPH